MVRCDFPDPRCFEAMASRVGTLFPRSETRERAMAYIKGLLSQCERKNGWQLAEWLGDASPDGVQYLLERARWDPEAAREVLRQWITKYLGSPVGVLILDGTGFIMKGQHSASVQRQYSVSRTDRLAFFSATPAPGEVLSSTMNCTCPRPGHRIVNVIARPGFPMRSALPVSRNWTGACWNGRSITECLPAGSLEIPSMGATAAYATGSKNGNSFSASPCHAMSRYGGRARIATKSDPISPWAMWRLELTRH